MLLHGDCDSLEEDIIRQADQLVSTVNPALLPDGSNITDAPTPKVVCNKVYGDIHDLDEDLADLVVTCQRHTRCSAAYCLRTKHGMQECRFGYPKPLRTKHGKQECRFGHPKPLQPNTAIITEEEPTLITGRNDGMINSFNPVQLSAWRANVDMQYIVSRQRVLQYCTKYVTKSEPRSQSPFTTIVRSLREGNSSLKAVQKLLINTVGALPRKPATYSYSSPCSRHHVTSSSSASMGLVLLKTTWRRVSVPQHSPLSTTTWDDSLHFNTMTLLEFARQYSMPKTLGAEPTRRTRRIVVIPRPYVSSDPAGDKYEQYCRQSLMQHQCFRQMDYLLSGYDNYIDAFLQSGHIPPCLQDDMYHLMQHTQSNEDDTDDSEVCVPIHPCIHIMRLYRVRYYD